MFSRYMFDALGVQWAATLLGCIATLLVPIPIAFYFYGAKIRERSKFAPTGVHNPMVALAHVQSRAEGEREGEDSSGSGSGFTGLKEK